MPPGIHGKREKKMADCYPETWELSSCELGHARRLAVRTRRYFSSCHQADGAAGCAIAHWRDANTETTIIVVPNSSWCLLCAMVKIAFCSTNRSRTHSCAEADVIVTSCTCKDTVWRTHIWRLQPRCCAVIWPFAVKCASSSSFTKCMKLFWGWGGWGGTHVESAISLRLTFRTLAAAVPCCDGVGHVVCIWQTRVWIIKLYLTPKPNFSCIKSLVSVFTPHPLLCVLSLFFLSSSVPVLLSPSPLWLP